MATTVQHKKSGVAGKVPQTTALALGELAINTADGFIYLKRNDGISGDEIYRVRGEPLTSIAVVDDAFTGDGVTTDFTLSRLPEDEQFVFVTINGVVQHTDVYTLNGRVLEFSSAPANGDSIETRVISVRSSALELRDYTTFVYSITGDTTTITGADDTGAILEYDLGKVEVYYNGARLVIGSDFTANDGTTITLGDTVTAGDTIEVVSLSKASFVDNNALGPISATLSTTQEQLVDRFQAEDFRSAKYIVQMESLDTYHVTEVLLVHDGTNVYLTEYGTISTNNSLGTINADIQNGYVRLLATPANSQTTTVKGHRITVTV